MRVFFFNIIVIRERRVWIDYLVLSLRVRKIRWIGFFIVLVFRGLREEIEKRFGGV